VHIFFGRILMGSDNETAIRIYYSRALKFDSWLLTTMIRCVARVKPAEAAPDSTLMAPLMIVVQPLPPEALVGVAVDGDMLKCAQESCRFSRVRSGVPIRVLFIASVKFLIGS
jgi:hypothetical protein